MTAPRRRRTRLQENAPHDPAILHTPCAFFCPAATMASDVGLDALTRPRDDAKVKADLARAGYGGEKVVLLVSADSVVQESLGDVAAERLALGGRITGVPSGTATFWNVRPA